jgi:tetratricopeptide (TPR) repeat protein
MSELYRLNSTDEDNLLAAGLLLRKLTASRTIRPAQLVTVAKLQYVLSMLPRVTNGVIASVSVCCPRHKFGDIETYHWWNFGIEDGRLRISSGGHFHDPQTGGDTFTTMTWYAVPGAPSEQEDYRESLRMVPDVRSYAEGVESIDFTAEEYHIEILDNSNPLLEEEGNQDDAEADRNAEEWFRKGLVFLDRESLEQAYACFRHGIEISPNHSMLQFALGQAFEVGIGVEKDDSQAVEWYQKAAEQGLIGAMFFLAQKYEFGQGIQSDPEKAMRWYRNAAEGGLSEAQFALGEHYLCDEVEPLTKHWEEAASWFRKAAEQGHSNAQLRLAGMYEDGLGIPQDLGAAEYWFRKAAEQGNVQARASLEQYGTD